MSFKFLISQLTLFMLVYSMTRVEHGEVRTQGANEVLLIATDARSPVVRSFVAIIMGVEGGWTIAETNRRK